MTNNQLTDDRLVKILSETQATIMEHNSRCVRGSVEVDARLFGSMLMELQERRKAERQADELTMWIKRLVRSLKNANPDSKLPSEAMDYLTAKGLISVGDILR